MPTYHADGIVLRRGNFGEADQIVTLLTRYHGKVSAVAKGVRRMGSRKGGNLDLLNHVKLYLAEGKSMDIITEVELVDAWPRLKVDLSRVAVSYQVIELANEFVSERQENKAVFDLTLAALKWLDEGDLPEQTLAIYQVKLLDIVGFQPQLDKCVRCGKALSPDGLALSPALGGVIGPEERENDELAWGISADTLKVWRFFLTSDFATGMKLKVPPTVARQVARSLQYYLEYLLERELKSPGLLRDVKSLQTGSK